MKTFALNRRTRYFCPVGAAGSDPNPPAGPAQVFTLVHRYRM